MISVAFIVRSTFYSSPGGDTIQALSTAKYLKYYDTEVDIKLTNEVIDYRKYDLLHFFNIIRPADILPHITQSNLPFVISSIYVDYSFYKLLKKDLLSRGILNHLSPDFLEYLKTIGRWIINGNDLPNRNYLSKGHKKSIKYLMQHAAYILPNSQSELMRLAKSYGHPKAYAIIPNGIDLETFKPTIGKARNNKMVICAGRIELRKNQLNLIRALNNTPFELYIIGNPSPNHIKYYNQCVREAANNVYFIDDIPQWELIEYYQTASIHALPSFFETTGLSSLEAAFLGCQIVITDKGDTRDYFGDHAYYCEPTDPHSIYNAIVAASKAVNSISFQQHITNNYTWNIAAGSTHSVYKKILSL